MGHASNASEDMNKVYEAAQECPDFEVTAHAERTAGDPPL